MHGEVEVTIETFTLFVFVCIISATGERWRSQRRLAVACTRALGMVRNTFAASRTEAVVLREAKDFVSFLLSHMNSDKITYDPEHALRHNIGTILNSLVFGKSWGRNDKTWLYLQQLQEEGVKYIGVAGPENFLPFMRYTRTAFKNYKYLTEGQKKTHKIYEDLIKDQYEIVQQMLNSTDTPEFENAIQVFLYERALLEEKNSSEIEYFCDNQFNHFLADLFGAGLDTTLVTLRWFLIFMALHQNYQAYVQEEINRIFENLDPNIDKMQDLPFLEACITESQRIRSVVPLGIPHSNDETLEFEGYTIPANSMILPLQWAIHMDSKRWQNPEKYNPYRFIDQDGNCKKPISFMPFQLGKRRCPGDDFAKMLLFIFSVVILQHFTILPAGKINLEGEHGITLNPQKHALIFKKRIV